jgi:hypothetical protein
MFVLLQSFVRHSFQSVARSPQEINPPALGLHLREQPSADRFLLALRKL